MRAARPRSVVISSKAECEDRVLIALFALFIVVSVAFALIDIYVEHCQMAFAFDRI